MTFFLQTPLEHDAILRLIVDDQDAGRDRGGNYLALLAGRRAAARGMCHRAFHAGVGHRGSTMQRNSPRLDFPRDQFGQSSRRAPDFFQILARARVGLTLEIFGDQLRVADDLIKWSAQIVP
jgi:hypothetical protein